MKNVELSWLEKISLKWRFEWRYIPKNIVHGIKNMWKWTPIIWKDRNWDSDFLLEIVKFKISKMSKSHGKLMPYVGFERNVEVMNTVVKLINKVQNEEYLHEYYDYHERKFEFVKVEGTDYWNVDTTVISDNLDEYFQKYPITMKRAENHPLYLAQPSREFLAMSMAQIRHDKAKKILFDTIATNMHKWWE
jgi:hypothetical protein